MAINSWLQTNIERVLGSLHSPTTPLSFIVEVETGWLERVEQSLSTISNVSVGRTAFRFIEVAAPAEVAEVLSRIPGVKAISYNMPKKILPLPRIGQFTSIEDPILGKVSIDQVISPSKLLGFDLLLPVSPWRFNLHHGPTGTIEIIATGDSRAVVLDIPTVLKGRGVTVAVLDTGWAPLVSIYRGKAYSTCMTDPTPWDGHGHGTWVASAACGSRDPAPLGLCLGLAEESNLVCIKVLNGTFGFGSTMDILKGIELAVEKGAKVISMSLGSDVCQGGCRVCPECVIITELSAKGIVFCIAAANSGPESWTIGCPGCSPEGISVGSVSMTDYPKPAWFSSRGPQNAANRELLAINSRTSKPDVLAPGGGRALEDSTPDEVILSGEVGWARMMYTGLPDPHGAFKGTSQATPHIAGLIACLLEGGRIVDTEGFKQVCEKNQPLKSPDTGWGAVKMSWFSRGGVEEMK